jgi:hypothetical protein
MARSPSGSLGCIKMDMSFGVDTLITVIAGVFAIIGVWTQLSNRLAILETKLEYGDEKFNAIDKKFDEVMMHLRRIEDKLDNKADR